jgi:hypothetical protein
MRTINQGRYEDGLEEFIQYGQYLIEEGLDPYLGEIKGHWKASIIGENLRASYERFVEISYPDFIPQRAPGACAYKNDGTIGEISSHLLEVISQAIFDYYSANGKGVIYVLDFRIFKKDVENKFLAIQKKRLCF